MPMFLAKAVSGVAIITTTAMVISVGPSTGARAWLTHARRSPHFLITLIDQTNAPSFRDFGCTESSPRHPLAPLQAIAVECPTMPLVEIS